MTGSAAQGHEPARCTGRDAGGVPALGATNRNGLLVRSKNTTSCPLVFFSRKSQPPVVPATSTPAVLGTRVSITVRQGGWSARAVTGCSPARSAGRRHAAAHRLTPL